MNDIKNYLNYVTDVLGLKSILLDASEKSPIILLVQVQDYEDISNEENELLQKMLAALKFDLQKIKIVDQNEPNQAAEYTLRMSHSPDFSIHKKNTYQTLSPRSLLKNPDKKKDAWAELQRLISSLKNL